MTIAEEFTSYFATDAEIGAEFFDGQIVPSDNTIQSDRHIHFKNKCMARVMFDLGKSKTDTVPTDIYGNYREAFLFLYKLMLDNIGINFPKHSELGESYRAILSKSKAPALRVTNKYQDVYGTNWSYDK